VLAKNDFEKNHNRICRMKGRSPATPEKKYPEYPVAALL
jgi:hypothetical protein